MSIALEPIGFRGWPNALRVRNDTVELVVTLDVGPRILSYTRAGSINPFNVYDDQAGGRGEPQWRNRGGHRLWLAPESPEFTYFPDNCSVHWEPLGDHGVRFIPPVESGPGFQKQFDLVLGATGARVEVVHRIIRTSASPCTAAPWALSVMAAGGVAILPQPPMGEHPRDLLPNRRLVLWPYTDLSDPRYRLGRRFFTIRQDPSARPTKIGLADKVGWAGYWVSNTLFIKHFKRIDSLEYPDDGCNVEVFTNARMLELESLGGLQRFTAGTSAELIEHWDLRTNLPTLDPNDEAALEEYFRLAPA